jgi:hypothetical protein
MSSDRNSMNELSSTARAILDAGRDADGAGDFERARVRKALMAKIAAGGALTATSAAAASTTAAAAPTAKILVAVAMVVAGGVGGTLAWRAQRTPAPAPVVAAAPVPAPVVAPTIVATPTPAPEPVAPVVRPAPARRPRPASTHAEAPANRLAEETALLAAANAELRNGDARRALGLLNDYDRRYPSGVLREEVLATRVIARCQIGLEPDATARRAANTFLTRHPASPLAPRVRSSCGR